MKKGGLQEGMTSLGAGRSLKATAMISVRRTQGSMQSSLGCRWPSLAMGLPARRATLRPAGLPSLARRPSARGRAPTAAAVAGACQATPLPATLAAISASASASVGASGLGAALMRAATGVPIEETFRHLTLQEAGVRTVVLISLAILSTSLAQRVVAYVGRLCDREIEKEMDSPRADQRPGALRVLVGTALAAVRKPAQALLPFLCFAFSSTVAAAFAEVLAVEVQAGGAASSRVLEVCHGPLVRGLSNLAQLMQDTSEFTVIVFVAWFVISWKDRVVQALLEQAEVATGVDDNIARIVSPLSTLLTWALVSAATLLSLAAFGINVQPLLAVGSVSTLAIGFAAQSTVSNVVSAFALYTSRPFIAGDRVQLKSMGGATVLSGTVQQIMPLHTIIRTDADTPVYVQNKDLTGSMMIVNETKLQRTGAFPALPSVDATITIRYRDVDCIPAVEASATAWMSKHPDLVHTGACGCSLEGFGPQGPVLRIKANIRREAAGRQAAVVSEVLREVERCVRASGAYLAVQGGPELPPAPAAAASLPA